MIISLGRQLLAASTPHRVRRLAEGSLDSGNREGFRRPKSSLHHLEFTKSLAGSSVLAGGVSHTRSALQRAGSSLWYWSSRVFTEYMTRGWALPTRRSYDDGLALRERSESK